MGLYKRGTVWWGRYTNKHGNQERRSLKTKNKKEAKRKLEELTEDLYTYTLSELYEKWHADNSYTLKPAYTSLVARSIKKFTQQHHDPLITKIDYHRLVAYRAMLGMTLSETSVRMYMKQFRVLMTYAVETLEILDKNPFRKIKMGKQEPRKRLLTLQEYNDILNAAREDKRPLVAYFFECLFLSGMRTGEIEHLKWKSNVSENQLHIVRSKTKAGERTININPELKQCLQNIRALQPEDAIYVLTNEKGKWMGRYRWLSKQFSKYRDQLGISKQIVCHTLRHTFANLLRNDGCSLDDIQLILGHSDIKTTAQYVKRKDTDVHIRPHFYKNSRS